MLQSQIFDARLAVEFADFVREAEYEALAYEGYAQHCLQDRWSSGHMWERWNAGDYARLPDTDPLRNLLIGSMAGIVHGAQSVLFNIPDPLCAPEVDGSTVTPIVWSSDELGLQPGVGDYRWAEIVGERIAQISEADRIENGVLIVKVSSPVWRNELVFMKSSLINSVNEALAKTVVKDIKFT